WEALRPLNLGMRAIQEEVTEEALARELGRYDAASQQRLVARVRQDASLEPALDRWIALYEEGLAGHRGGRAAGPAGPRAVADYLAFVDGVFARLTSQERALHLLRQGLQQVLTSQEAMSRLPDGAVARLSLRVEDMPERLSSGARTVVRVQVKNGCQSLL